MILIRKVYSLGDKFNKFNPHIIQIATFHFILSFQNV